MKITIELTNLDEVKAVVAALEGRNAQAVMSLAPSAQPVEPKSEVDKSKVKPRPKKAAAEVQAEETVETVVEADQPSDVEPQEGDIDDATMREVGGKLLRELNGKGKDGVGELTKILGSLNSKKVTEVPMNLRPRFVSKVTEALA